MATSKTLAAPRKRAARRAERTGRRAAGPAVAAGRVHRVEQGRAEVRLPAGEVVSARLPQHVSAPWLEAAVRIGPVEAAVARLDGGGAILWCLFPGPEHASVPVELELSGTRVVIRGDRSLELQCGPSTIVLDADGSVRVRGKEILSRASGVHRIKGGAVRIN